MIFINQMIFGRKDHYCVVPSVIQKVTYTYHISREKFEPEPGFELGPTDPYPSALPLSYPGSPASSSSSSPLEITAMTEPGQLNGRAPGSGGPTSSPGSGSNFSLEM